METGPISHLCSVLLGQVFLRPGSVPLTPPCLPHHSVQTGRGGGLVFLSSPLVSSCFLPVACPLGPLPWMGEVRVFVQPSWDYGICTGM